MSSNATILLGICVFEWGMPPFYWLSFTSLSSNITILLVFFVFADDVQLLMKFFEAHITQRAWKTQCELHQSNSHWRKLNRLLTTHMWVKSHTSGGIAWVSPSNYIIKYLLSCPHLVPTPNQPLPILLSFDGMSCGMHITAIV